MICLVVYIFPDPINMSDTQARPSNNIPDTDARKAWLSTLAKAPSERVLQLWAKAGLSPDHDILRSPEIGAVMVRGRAGATGSPFNLGEMSVTRCSVRLREGCVGHGYVQGRSKEHARIAALVDALMQTPLAPKVRVQMLQPLQKEARDAATSRQKKAAATKVEFFTMARGED